MINQSKVKQKVSNPISRVISFLRSITEEKRCAKSRQNQNTAKHKLVHSRHHSTPDNIDVEKYLTSFLSVVLLAPLDSLSNLAIFFL